MEIMKWVLELIDLNAHPAALKHAIECDVPRTLTTILSLSKLTQASLDQALQWAVETGSVMRMNHLLQAGASPSVSKALLSAVQRNNTLICHKLLSQLK